MSLKSISDLNSEGDWASPNPTGDFQTNACFVSELPYTTLLLIKPSNINETSKTLFEINSEMFSLGKNSML